MQTLPSPPLFWYMVTPLGAFSLPVAPGTQGFEHLYDGLPLGVYTVFRTFGHSQFLYLEEHLDRMDQSMGILGWPERVERPLLLPALQKMVDAAPWPESRVRVDVLAAPLARAPQPGRLLVALQALVPPSPAALQNGVTLALAPELARDNPLAKTAGYYQARTTYLESVQQRAYEYLLLDAKGRILEGTSSNFYAVLDGVMYTAGEGVLEGITRRIVLHLANEMGLPVRLEPLSLEALPRVSEAFITSAGRGLVPAVQIGSQLVGAGKPGPVFAQLLAAYQQFIEQNCRPAWLLP